MKNRIQKHYRILSLAAIVITLIITYLKFSNSLPLGVHSWAQSDRYSVAYMFQGNANFFAPQTHNLSSENGRCGVEFPLIQYTSARLSLILGKNRLPFLYRLINLLVLLTGIIYLFSKWKPRAITPFLLGVVTLTSPVLVFYGFNFLPDTAGVGVLFIALGQLLIYDRSGQLKHGLFALGFSALASLLKTTCGIYFLGIAGGLGLYELMSKNWKRTGIIVLLTLILGGIVASYDYYFFHEVNRTLWSPIFMSQSQPIGNWTELKAVWKGIRFWHGQFLTWPATIGLGILGILALLKKRQPATWTVVQLTTWICAVGVVAFLGLMGKQFQNHDYYYIAGFSPLLILICLSITRRLQGTKWLQHRLISLGFVVLTIWGLFNSVSDFAPRMESHFFWKERDIINDIVWLQDGQQLLDDMGMPGDAKIFVGYAAAPNTSLVYFNRRGKVFNHEEMARDSSNMDYWSNRIQPDYYVFPSAWQSKLATDQPKLYRNIILFAKRDGFYIYKPI
ncbi:MAG: hypothetical protein JJ975_11585 [Bacteroidia bacterium]|nr:hypothetical protein [Bacteroidia bacterium]